MDKHGTFMKIKYNIVIVKYKNISWINYTPQMKITYTTMTVKYHTISF